MQISVKFGDRRKFFKIFVKFKETSNRTLEIFYDLEKILNKLQRSFGKLFGKL